MRIPALAQSCIFVVLSALLSARETLAVEIRGLRHDLPPRCHRNSVRVRKEWGDMSLRDRRHYIDAVLCFQKKPSLLNHALYNATSRYDDFVAVHMNQTRYVHHNGLFLPWHRGFISLFERALARECGYKGTLPYWDWVKNAKNVTASPLFDGSEYSFSGQGLPVPDGQKIASCDSGGVLVCPSGPGGGCVTDGPFKDYIWGYLPVPFSVASDPKPGLPADVFAYVPRCFTRDLNQYIATHFQTPALMRSLMAKTTIADFRLALDAEGLHLAGHGVAGGANANIFVSVMEPTFFLHHAMVDRVWTQWQAVDPWDRTFGDNAIEGTVTSFNIPPSENATAETMLNWGPLGPARKLADMLAVGREELCYTYT